MNTKKEEYIICPQCEQEAYKESITCPFCNFGILAWPEGEVDEKYNYRIKDFPKSFPKIQYICLNRKMLVSA